jgi:transposase
MERLPPEYGPHKTIYNRFARWRPERYLAKDTRGSRKRIVCTAPTGGVQQQPYKSSPLRNGAQRGAQAQAIGRTKGGQNTKIQAAVDELCRPWVLILTPGNTHDSVMAPPCVSLIPGVTQLIADKGYDTDAFRKYLKDQGIKRSSQANPTARSAFDMIKRLTRAAMSSSVASATSKTSGASPLAMISWHRISCRRSASLQFWRTGSGIIEPQP